MKKEKILELLNLFGDEVDLDTFINELDLLERLEKNRREAEADDSSPKRNVPAPCIKTNHLSTTARVN